MESDPLQLLRLRFHSAAASVVLLAAALLPFFFGLDGCTLASASAMAAAGDGIGRPFAAVERSSDQPDPHYKSLQSLQSLQAAAGSRRVLQSRRYALRVLDAVIHPNFGYYVLDAKGVESSAYAKDIVMTPTEILYFLEYNDTAAQPIQSLKKAEKSTDPASTSGYAISTVAGPWKMPVPGPGDDLGPAFQADGILMPSLPTGLSMILLTDHSAGVVRKIDYRTGGSGVLLSMDSPGRLARHPTDPIVYVSTRTCIYGVAMAENQFAPATDPKLLTGDNRLPGFVDAVDLPLDSKFANPLIGSRAISANGTSLYVADQLNNAVRRVDLITGATTTIAGMIPPESTEHTPERGPSLRARGNAVGSPHLAEFKDPIGLAVTADGCNLFVAEGEGARIQWLKLKNVDGDVIEARKIASLHDDTSNTTVSGRFTSITLSDGDRYLLVGAVDARIYKMELNTSLLYRCGPPAASSTLAGQNQPPQTPTVQIRESTTTGGGAGAVRFRIGSAYPRVGLRLLDLAIGVSMVTVATFLGVL